MLYASEEFKEPTSEFNRLESLLLCTPHGSILIIRIEQSWYIAANLYIVQKKLKLIRIHGAALN